MRHYTVSRCGEKTGLIDKKKNKVRIQDQSKVLQYMGCNSFSKMSQYLTLKQENR